MSGGRPGKRVIPRAALGILLCASIIVVACRGALDPEPGPRPAPVALTVRLEPGGPAGGSIQLLITGGPVDSLDSALRRFSASVRSDRHRVIILGRLQPGPLLRFWVPDRDRTNLYRVIVEQAAAPRTYAQIDPAAFRVALETDGAASPSRVSTGFEVGTGGN